MRAIKKSSAGFVHRSEFQSNKQWYKHDNVGIINMVLEQKVPRGLRGGRANTSSIHVILFSTFTTVPRSVSAFFIAL